MEAVANHEFPCDSEVGKWDINIYFAVFQNKIPNLIRIHATTKAVIAAPGERFNNGILTNIDIAQRSREFADT